MRAGIAAIALAAAACGRISLSADAAGDDDDATDAGTGGDAWQGSKALDVLFVIDNSGTMREEQMALVNAFPDFLDHLRQSGELPDLHIGIVSSNMGVGPDWDIQGCAGPGDDGLLQFASRGACTGPSDPFIVDVSDGAGGRTQNYPGALQDVFACIAPLGTSGCGFEQPLASMKRALDGTKPQNAGFLRDGAGLLVVIVSDEDDCSVYDTDMFDTSQTAISDPLGPLSSFRCFEFGVQCSPDFPRTPGAKSGCIPRDPSDYMVTPHDYGQFLNGLRPGRVAVVAIAGPPGPVNVSLGDGGNPTLDPACSSPTGGATPGVRFDAFQAAFDDSGRRYNICTELRGAMQAAGDLARDKLLP
jgi:hypothetical protein